MAKRKADYIDGLLEVASQIEDARADASAPGTDPEDSRRTSEAELSLEGKYAAEHGNENSDTSAGKDSGQIPSLENQRRIRAHSVRTTSIRPPYIRIGTKRLYVVRSQSGQVQNIDWRAMGPSLPQPVAIQERFYPMDNEVDDLLMPDLNLTQQAVYRFLYRSSYGWGRCVCAASFETIQKGTGIKSRVTVQKAIDSLQELGCIAIEYDKSPVTPRVYKVHLPCEMKAYEGRSKRAENIRLEGIRSNNIRLENEEVLVQKMNVSSPENERIENERKTAIEASSCDTDDAVVDEHGPKYSTKHITVKNSSRRDKLKLLLSSHELKVNQDKIDEWAANESLELDEIERYIKWVITKASKGECKRAEPFLVRAIDGRWPIDTEEPSKEAASLYVAAEDPQAEEDKAIREHIAAMSPEEQEALAKQALDLASGEWVYKRAKTQEVRDGVVRSKMIDIVRRTLRETAITSK